MDFEGIFSSVFWVRVFSIHLSWGVGGVFVLPQCLQTAGSVGSGVVSIDRAVRPVSGYELDNGYLSFLPPRLCRGLCRNPAGHSLQFLCQPL